MLDDNAEEIYSLILSTANTFLHQAMNYTVTILAEERPTYQHVADLVEAARQLIHPALEDHDVHLADQANEYCYLMGKIGAAIKNEDQKALDEWCEKLAKKPFVMPS